jgi:hypothetical protein
MASLPTKSKGNNHTSFFELGVLGLLFCSNLFAGTTTIVDAYSPRHQPFIRQKDLIGIWKLTHSNLQLPTTAPGSTSTDEQQTNDANEISDVLVFRLNEDGTFDPYTRTPEEGDPTFHQILGRGGTWKYQEKALILAANRPEGLDPSNKIHDTVLSGRLQIQTSQSLPASDQAISDHEETSADDANCNSEGSTQDDSEADVDVQLSVPEGQVLVGKFMYPKTHNAFFDEPMLFHQSCIGSFAISQLLGNLNARLKEERETPKPIAKFHKKDFYGRRFYVTATPHKINPSYAAADIHFDEDKVVHDIRVTPISFHANNTFTGQGTEKTLRGRFGIAGEERDRLWFQVSLFGAGRSAPGSVYSEGRLLSHDDRRGYVGNIQTTLDPKTNQTLVFVEGEMYFGTDLKTPKKPNSMGLFSMQEIITEEVDEDEDEDEMEDEEDENDSDGPVRDFGVSDDVFQ